jgi:DNA-binding XRE family transcriptional regulator
MAKTVIPDGKKIAQLREDRGWNQEELGLNADVSLRTIQSIEQGKACLRCTLTSIAKPLGVEFKEIVSGYEPDKDLNHKRLSGVKVTIQFVIDKSLKESDQTELVTYLKDLIRRINGGGDIDGLSVKDGSMILEVEMDVEDIKRLLSRWAMGDLRDFKIKQIIIPDGIRFPKFSARGSPYPDAWQDDDSVQTEEPPSYDDDDTTP